MNSETRGSEVRNNPLAAAALIFTALCVSAWLFFLLRYSINPDNAVLTEFARRALLGGQFGIDYADTNPPYNIFLYAPPALLSLAGLPAQCGIALYGLALLGLGIFLCAKLLRTFEFLSPPDRAIFLGAFAMAALAMSGPAFAERDHLIIFGLTPFLLAQFAFAENIKTPKTATLASLIFGAALVLVKPHYGLAPAAMIAWRAAKSKSLSQILRPDTLILSIAVLSYAALNAVFFKSYWTDFLPYLGKNYIFAGLGGPLISLQAKILIGGMATLAYLSRMLGDTPKRRLLTALAAASACMFVAYLAQYKGLPYQLIPALILCFTALCLALAPAKSFPAKTPATLAMAALFLMTIFPPKPSFPTHEQYKNLPLSAALKDCKTPCTFLIDGPSLFGTFETATYNGGFNATRFSTFWFETDLACGRNIAELTPYARMVGEDLARHKPEILILYRDENPCAPPADPNEASPMPKPFGQAFAVDGTFSAEWKNYRFERSITLNRRDYFRGTPLDYDHDLTYDIFRRSNLP